MTRKRGATLERFPIPQLNRIVAQTRDDLVIVILQTVDAFRILALAVDALQLEIATAPV